MLNEYFQLGNRIRKHYVSPGVILCLVTGRFVPPIHRKNLYSLQYSMLPKQRVSIPELWAKLSEKRVDELHANGWPTSMNGYMKLGNGVPGGGGRRR
jgi:phosphatidylinositol glycan class Q protein